MKKIKNILTLNKMYFRKKIASHQKIKLFSTKQLFSTKENKITRASKIQINNFSRRDFEKNMFSQVILKLVLQNKNLKLIRKSKSRNKD